MKKHGMTLIGFWSPTKAEDAERLLPVLVEPGELGLQVFMPLLGGAGLAALWQGQGRRLALDGPDDELKQLGYATSLMYSPMLQRHIALARVPLALSTPGSRVRVELAVSHRYEYFDAYVTRLPLYNPDRRTA